METYFQPHGKLSRGAYIKQLIKLAVQGFLVALFFTILAPIPRAVMLTATLVVYTYAAAMATVKRLHDIGRPGSHYFLLLIPFYNLYLQCCLLFKKGV